jgi:asparagine synthase (glutamine-hydrolysing)
MCGICGSYKINGQVDRKPATDMVHRIAHRGPDEILSYDIANLSVKTARLTMTGLHNGWQPCISSNSRFICMANGEIFNARDLIREYGLNVGHNLSDIAVIPEIIANFGIEGLSLIDGQFAAAIYDSKLDELLLMRDRFGICPLYYSERNGTIHFCSELKPLVQSVEGSWSLDLEAVDQYFSLGNIVAPVTIVSEVRSIKPGSVIIFSKSSPLGASEHYWRYGLFNTDDNFPSSTSLRDSLVESVSSRMAAEVEIGSYLSGGLDSTALAILARRELQHPLSTFSSTTPGSSIDESKYQKIVVNQYDIEHHEVPCTPSDIHDLLEQSIRHCCAPQRETYNVAALQLSRSVNAHGIKGVISGEGADELFYGYDSYLFDHAGKKTHAEDARNKSAWGRSDFSWEVNWDNIEKRKKLYLNNSYFNNCADMEFWKRRLIPFSDAEVKDLTLLQMRSIADVYVQLSGHLLGDHGDAMVMNHSVEGRYPFLSNSIVEFVLRCPDEQKIENFETKAILKKAVRGLIPDEIIDRGKQGFTSPSLSLNEAFSDDRVAYWRQLVDSAKIFNTSAVLADFGKTNEKWDFALSAISIAIIVDELKLEVEV